MAIVVLMGDEIYEDGVGGMDIIWIGWTTMANEKCNISYHNELCLPCAGSEGLFTCLVFKK